MNISRAALRPIVACALLIACAGCDNAFSPKQEYRERLVVYAVLDASEPYQVVRLERTYDAEGTNPDQPKEKKPVTDATVSIATARKVYPCRDTVIETAGGSKTIWITRDLVGPFKGGAGTRGW